MSHKKINVSSILIQTPSDVSSITTFGPHKNAEFCLSPDNNNNIILKRIILFYNHVILINYSSPNVRRGTCKVMMF